MYEVHRFPLECETKYGYEITTNNNIGGNVNSFIYILLVLDTPTQQQSIANTTNLQPLR